MNKSLRCRLVSIKLSSHVKDGGLAEIYQSMATKMAVLRRDGENEFTRITPLVVCRDFLTDVFSFSEAKKVFDIYGCSFDPSLDTVQKDGVFLQMIFPNNKAQENFEKNLHHLFEIELGNDYLLTEYIPTENKLECVLIGDKRWRQSCLAFSLYTSLLRVFCYDCPDEGWIPAMRKLNGNKFTDARLVASVDDETWERVCCDLSVLNTEAFCGLPVDKHDVHEVHHNSGFYSVFGTHRELNPETVKKNIHWQKFKEAGWKLHTQ